MHFADEIIELCREKGSRLVVGLDPHWSLIPESFKNKYSPDQRESLLFDYFSNVVDASIKAAVMFKPQSAFFEQFGQSGYRALQRLIAHIHSSGGKVLMDAKRNDIGTTASAYATTYFGSDTLPPVLPSDALTVNGYLGSDGLLPFQKCLDRGIFVLVKTSNPSSGELQDLILNDGRSVAEAVADKVQEMALSTQGRSGYGNAGAVVGATYPDHMKALRRRLKNALLLVPGYGAQGGDDAAITASFDGEGMGALINSSRGICFPKDFEFNGFDAVRSAALHARNHIQSLLPN